MDPFVSTPYQDEKPPQIQPSPLVSFVSFSNFPIFSVRSFSRLSQTIPCFLSHRYVFCFTEEIENMWNFFPVICRSPDHKGKRSQRHFLHARTELFLTYLPILRTRTLLRLGPSVQPSCCQLPVELVHSVGDKSAYLVLSSME